MWRVGILYRAQDLLSAVAEDRPDAQDYIRRFAYFVA